MTLLHVVISAAIPYWRSQPQGKAFMATFWEVRHCLGCVFPLSVPLSTAIHSCYKQFYLKLDLWG